MARRFVSLLLALLISCSVSPAWTAPSPNDNSIQNLMRLSGLEQQIRQIPSQVVLGFDRQGRKLPVEQHTALRRALTDSFNSSRMERQVFQELQTGLRPEVVERTLAWLRSDLGRKVTLLEEESSGSKAMEELQAFVQQLQKTGPAQDRLQLVRRLDQAANATELMLDVTESMLISTASAYEATLPAAQRVGLDRIRVQISQQRSTWRPQVQNQIVVTMLYTYRSLSLKELEAYVTFLETEHGLEYSSQASAALKHALDLSIHRASGVMMDILKPPAGRKSL